MLSKFDKMHANHWSLRTKFVVEGGQKANKLQFKYLL